MDLNKVQLIGRATEDPEVRTTPSGSVVNLTLVTQTEWVHDGVKMDKPEFHNIVCFRKLADVVARFTKLGHTLYVEGKLQTRSWEKDGITKWKTEVVADQIIFFNNAR